MVLLCGMGSVAGGLHHAFIFRTLVPTHSIFEDRTGPGTGSNEKMFTCKGQQYIAPKKPTVMVPQK